ncbi:hypothetical protein TrCOL_g10744 [Triparma columacea]|uniref:AP2/ERF domain-containing protein n=1 Tax=Triparma columacea TaxID=722753 RepID=A0A9W7G0K6_9STRA|nr:hypothetical protein TrCOL_g10744 [Triparma columacea]
MTPRGYGGDRWRGTGGGERKAGRLKVEVHLDKILSINSPSFFRQVPRSMYFASTSPSYTTSESAAARTPVEVGSPKRDPISGVRGRGGSIVSSTTTAIMSPIGPTSTSTTPFLSPICGVRGELKKTGGEEAEERASFPSSPVAGQGIGAIERGVWGADWKMGIFGRREEEEEEEVGGGVMEELEYDHYKEYMSMIGNLRSGVKTPDGKGFDGHFLSAPSPFSSSSGLQRSSSSHSAEAGFSHQERRKLPQSSILNLTDTKLERVKKGRGGGRDAKKVNKGGGGKKKMKYRAHKRSQSYPPSSITRSLRPSPTYRVSPGPQDAISQRRVVPNPPIVHRLLSRNTERPSGKWQAQLYYSGKSRYIGVYDSLAEASLAHEVAREMLGAGNEGGGQASRELEEAKVKVREAIRKMREEKA